MLSRAVAGASLRLRSRLADPAAVQREHLERIVAANRSSRFGREHGFGAIGNEADYAQRVPVRSYEQLSPWIEAVASGVAGELTEAPVVAFEETGGSTAGPRLVPYTASGLAEFQTGLHAWLDDLFVAFPGLARGSFYWSISPACRAARTTGSGIAVGLASDAAYFGAGLAPHIVASLAVPASLAACSDVADWRWQTLAHLLARDDLAMISVWSPSFLTELLSFVGPGADFAQIWPRLALISCWDQASARAPAERLRTMFPGVRVQGKGLLATECLVSIPLHDQTFPVLAVDSGWFEFREPSGRMRTAATVEDGGDYELVLTNASGLYRYAIGDVVRVRGFVGRTPMLEFRGRSGGTDLCGEKLTEAFVLQALAPHALQFAALALDSAAMRYLLLVDAAEVGDDASTTIATRVEHDLHRNPQYAHARALGQLGAVGARRCTSPTARWIELRSRAGQRLGDIKLPALISDEGLRRELEA